MTYNHEPYITQAIEGILCQKTSFPFELLIGEDCSTDRTREIVMDFQKKNISMSSVLSRLKKMSVHTKTPREQGRRAAVNILLFAKAMIIGRIHIS